MDFCRSASCGHPSANALFAALPIVLISFEGLR
jgi:hypothetical protein